MCKVSPCTLCGIDKTLPELKFSFDQTKKDLVFSATDNISSPDKIIIVDQGGIVTAINEAMNTVQLKFKVSLVLRLCSQNLVLDRIAIIAFDSKNITQYR